MNRLGFWLLSDDGRKEAAVDEASELCADELAAHLGISRGEALQAARGAAARILGVAP